MKKLNAKEICEKGYYEQLLARVNYLERLAETTTENGIPLREDAFTLCFCHLDGLANEFYKEGSPRGKFIKALIEFGGLPVFGAVHPAILASYLMRPRHDGNKKLNNLYVLIKPFLDKLSDKKRFFSQEELCDLIDKNLSVTESQQKVLKQNLPNGSYAAMAYEELRCRAIHRLGVKTYYFSESTFNGQPVEEMSFPVLFKVLKNVICDERVMQTVKASCFSKE
ncbi:MAG TPA: hypothetical protein VGV92_09045 [Gammaproteobacteria bacterium]|nr:hypothetical protein [Gammaproteobacteria bacterium]